MRTSYQSTTSRPSPSGPNATRGRRAGRSTAAATTRGSSSPGPGKSSSACRNSAARPSGRLSSSATAGARPLSRRLSSRCTWRASQPRGSRTSPSSSGGGAGVHREDGERRVRRDTGLHGIPAGALAPDQDEQRDRTHRPRDQEEDEGRRDLPGRQLGRHTGVSETEVHSGARMGQEEVPGHVQTGGDGRAEGKSGGLEEDEAEDG